MARYSKAKILKLLRESDNAPNTYIKGAKLEELGRYIVEKIPGIEFCDKNFLDGTRSQEIDLAFTHQRVPNDILISDPIIIIECKNKQNAIGSIEVGWFVRKLQDRGLNYGVIMSLSGITGSNAGTGTGAYAEVYSTLIRDKIRIILIDRNEILGLNNTEELVELIRTKIIQLTLYKTSI
jgi:hypothetical protein